MIVRAGTGWQYLLADLSLILFMVTAAAMAQSVDDPKAATTTTISPKGEPIALYRVAAGAPPLGEWLHDQSPDARQQLTIVAQYVPGGQAEALSKAQALAEEAGEAGTKARIVVEPGAGGTIASLAYDVPEASMARDLRGSKQSNSLPKDKP
jgi:hypothetical protein